MTPELQKLLTERDLLASLHSFLPAPNGVDGIVVVVNALADGRQSFSLYPYLSGELGSAFSHFVDTYHLTCGKVVGSPYPGVLSWGMPDDDPPCFLVRTLYGIRNMDGIEVLDGELTAYGGCGGCRDPHCMDMRWWGLDETTGVWR